MNTVLLLSNINSSSKDVWKVTGNSLQGQKQFLREAVVVSYICYCSHYQRQIVGYAIKLFTGICSTKLKGFFWFWGQWLWLSIQSISQRYSTLGYLFRFPQGLALPHSDTESFLASLGATSACSPATCAKAMV